MTIPKKVKIGGILYYVSITSDWPGKNDSDGECCFTKKTGNIIFINSELTQEAQELTFMHECLHAMNSTMDHEFLDSLAQQLYAFNVDNGLWKKNGDQ